MRPHILFERQQKSNHKIPFSMWQWNSRLSFEKYKSIPGIYLQKKGIRSVSLKGINPGKDVGHDELSNARHIKIT